MGAFFGGDCSNHFLLKQLVRKFDSVRMLFIASVIFRQHFFQPLRLFCCNRVICRFWVVTYEELLAATVTSERSHLLGTYGFLAAALFYCHRPHFLILD